MPARGSALNAMIEALRSLKNPVCEAAADTLENYFQRTSFYDLHLRHGMLSESDARIISTSLTLVHKKHNIQLKSFSVSYNPNIKSTGAAAILIALPEHVKELGMVGCNLNDEAGPYLIEFIKRAKYLKMVCVEQNGFSTKMKEKISDLKEHNTECKIIV